MLESVNIFTTAAFLQTVGELDFPGRRRAIELCRVEGRVLPLLVLDGRTVVESAPFYDFPQPLDVVPAGPVRELPYFPRTVVRTEPIEARVAPEPQGLRPSPFVDWSRFPDRAAFEAWVEARGGRVADGRRKRKKLEKDLGPLHFVFDDPRPEAFDACVRWKAAQYVATGVQNLFAQPRNVELFRRLRQRGVLVVNSLSAGSTLLSVHLGSLHDGRLTWWVPAYDPAFGRYSPGRVLLEELLRESQARGHREFDFLIGAEDYKFVYATHNRVIGPLGTPPLRARMISAGRHLAHRVLDRSPRALAWARKLRDTLRAR